MMKVFLKKVNPDQLLSIRSKVLRNNSDFKFCRYDGDNANSSIHIGAFNSKEIIGGVSLIKNDSTHIILKNCYQLRGMCVNDEYQKKGIGKKIINYAEICCKELQISNLWMNARIKALKFYLKLNYIDSEIKYDIKGIGLHHFLYKKI
tara:strand:+ start:123 stop:566 length:444 start_codon:yes stop_codon:yes gene_type:complete